MQKVTLGRNETLRITAEGEFIWHPEADAMIEHGDFTSNPAMRHILRALRKPQRTWVGLDVEDYIKALELCDFDKDTAFEFFEAKLKELNT